MFLCYRLLPVSYPIVANIFHKRNHTTVIAAVRKVKVLAHTQLFWFKAVAWLELNLTEITHVHPDDFVLFAARIAKRQGFNWKPLWLDAYKASRRAGDDKITAAWSAMHDIGLLIPEKIP